MDLLKLRLREERVLLETIDEEPDTIIILDCFNPILRMKRLDTVVPRRACTNSKCLSTSIPES